VDFTGATLFVAPDSAVKVFPSFTGKIFYERSFVVPRKAKKGKYKLKTHKATAKRFRLTGSGKLVRTKGGKSHFRRRTSKRTKALFTEMVPVQGKGFKKRIKRLAPYLSKYKANPNARSGKS
jgi:large subunit ribosomal protein L35